MKRLIATLAVLCSFASVALAQTAPNTGDLYFVGPTEWLFKIRAALASQFSDQAWIHGYTGFPEAVYSAPFDTPNCMLDPRGCTDGRYGPGPMKLGDGTLDCMEAYYTGPDSAWNMGNAMYLGNTAEIDVDPTESVVLESVEVPTVDALVDPENLPALCKQKLVDDYCGPIPGVWAERMCSWGEVYCCSP